MNRQEYLQNLCNELRTEFQYEFEVVFRGRGGWWGIPDEPRFRGDLGEYLGKNWQEAEKHLRFILG